MWPLESEEAEPLENAAPEDVERVMRGSKDPLDDEVASGDLGGCLALKGLVDLERLESKFRPTLEALDPRLKIGEKNVVILIKDIFYLLCVSTRYICNMYTKLHKNKTAAPDENPKGGRFLKNISKNV